MAPLHQAGIDGAGQAIAIVSLEAFPPDYSKTQDDVSTFRSTFGAKGPAPVDVKVDGGGSTSDFGEDDLDLDVICAIAPGAQIVNYEAPKSSAGLVDVFSRVVADGRVKIASFSWGICDAGMPARGAQERRERAEARGAARHHRLRGERRQRLLRLPAEQLLRPLAHRRLPVGLAAGRLGRRDAALGADERRVRHRVGLGGPVLERGRRRRDQHVRRRTVVAGRRACRERAAACVPDVSASASPTSGWLVRDYGNWELVRRHERRGAVLGGLDAARRATRARSRASSGRASSRRSSTSSPRRISPTRRSTTSGTAANRHYDAGPGWDYATGLGSPDVYNLARDLVAYLRTHPCPARQGPGTG